MTPLSRRKARDGLLHFTEVEQLDKLKASTWWDDAERKSQVALYKIDYEKLVESGIRIPDGSVEI